MQVGTDIDLSHLSRTEMIYLQELLTTYDERLRYNKLDQWFPETGPFQRAYYDRHIQFIQAGAGFKERALFGANRAGKSTTAAYEIACHLTGIYPKWWTGKKFEDEAVKIWCVGDSHGNVRDICQYLLLGNIYDLGTGMVPKHLIVGHKTKPNVPNAISEVIIQHSSGGKSECSFKSYEQGRKAFQGTSQHVIWLDEEPTDPDIYSECLTRTMTTRGIIILTFTPLSGLSDTVLRFLPGGRFPPYNIADGKDGISRWISQVTWENAPHIPIEEQKILLASYLPHEIEARTKGVPSIGAGKVFTVPEDDLSVEPFTIPPHWPRFFGLDIPFFSGSCAAVFIAHDTDNDVLYVYDVYKSSNKHLAIHCEAIRRRGIWIPGVIDPSSLRKDSEGKEFCAQYKEQGLDVVTANNAIEAGIQAINVRLIDGRMKIFTSCQQLWEEYRLYRFDKSGKIAKNQEDHLMDALRYAIMSGIRRAIIKPDDEENERLYMLKVMKSMSRDDVTGY